MSYTSAQVSRVARAEAGCGMRRNKASARAERVLPAQLRGRQRGKADWLLVWIPVCAILSSSTRLNLGAHDVAC